MPWWSKALSWAAFGWPKTLGVVTNALVGMARWILRTGVVTRRIDTFLESKKKEKKESSADDELGMEGDEKLTTAQRRERLLRLSFDGFSQGAEGFVHEARLLSQLDWGFRFEDVDYNSIKIWHGSKDINAPVQMIRYMAARLPHGVLHEFDDTHFTMHKHLERVFSELVPEQVVDQHKGSL
jgi:hypothetical protein